MGVRPSSATRRFEGDSRTPTTANLAARAPGVEPCRERRDAPCVRTLAASRGTRLVNGLVMKRDRKRTFRSVRWRTASFRCRVRLQKFRLGADRCVFRDVRLFLNVASPSVRVTARRASESSAHRIFRPTRTADTVRHVPPRAEVAVPRRRRRRARIGRQPRLFWPRASSRERHVGSAERRTAGAKLRAELPPGPLPDTTPPTTSKLLARLMSRDGMTPGDRARKQARLREMRDALAAKENVSPENRGEAPSSRDSRVERLESPTIYMSQQEVTDEKHGGDASPSDMDLSATETAPVPAVPVVVPADAMSEPTSPPRTRARGRRPCCRARTRWSSAKRSWTRRIGIRNKRGRLRERTHAPGARRGGPPSLPRRRRIVARQAAAAGDGGGGVRARGRQAGVEGGVAASGTGPAGGVAARGRGVGRARRRRLAGDARIAGRRRRRRRRRGAARAASGPRAEAERRAEREARGGGRAGPEQVAARAELAERTRREEEEKKARAPSAGAPAACATRGARRRRRRSATEGGSGRGGLRAARPKRRRAPARGGGEGEVRERERKARAEAEAEGQGARGGGGGREQGGRARAERTEGGGAHARGTEPRTASARVSPPPNPSTASRTRRGRLPSRAVPDGGRPCAELARSSPDASAARVRGERRGAAAASRGRPARNRLPGWAREPGVRARPPPRPLVRPLGAHGGGGRRAPPARGAAAGARAGAAALADRARSSRTPRRLAAARRAPRGCARRSRPCSSCSRSPPRVARRLTPAQLAAHYEEAAEEGRWRRGRGARRWQARNAEKLRRAQPRAIERVALEAAWARSRRPRS